MRYGYWLPVFGGWLRNVERRAHGGDLGVRVPPGSSAPNRSAIDLTLVAELNLNDIKGADAPSLDAWSTAAALAAVTKTQEIMVAVRPTFHNPALLAKQAANIDHISGGRLSLNVVTSWWADEARKYGVSFEQHDDRYARTEEWLTVVNGVWQQDHFSHRGPLLPVEDNVLQPKPVTDASAPDALCRRRVGGRQEPDRADVRRLCDARRPARKDRRAHRDMNARRERFGLAPMMYGVAATASCGTRKRRRRRNKRASRTSRVPRRATTTISNGWPARKLEQQVSLEDYSVSNRGLRSGLVGTPAQVQEQIAEFEAQSAWISCSCNAVRNWKRWSASPLLLFRLNYSPPRRQEHQEEREEKRNVFPLYIF